MGTTCVGIKSNSRLESVALKNISIGREAAGFLNAGLSTGCLRGLSLIDVAEFTNEAVSELAAGLQHNSSIVDFAISSSEEYRYDAALTDDQVTRLVEALAARASLKILEQSRSGRSTAIFNAVDKLLWNNLMLEGLSFTRRGPRASSGLSGRLSVNAAGLKMNDRLKTLYCLAVKILTTTISRIATSNSARFGWSC